MSTQFSYCRACSGFCGVEISNEDGHYVVTGDRSNPKNAGYTCELATESLNQTLSDDRLTEPMRRVGGQLVPSTWEEAIEAIGADLKALRKKNGSDAIGVFAGPGLAANPLGAVRSAAFAVGLGSPHLYSDLTMHGAPQLYAAEQMLGTPMALQADVGRAHYTLLLGDCDQDVAGWGPMQSGTIHTQALKHIQRTRRSAKLVAVGSRKTPLAELADEYISIRPGTETAFLLGLCHATWAGGWIDHQYMRDYCSNSEQLKDLLAPWTPAAVAEICGTEASKISGVALKFSRAPMATVAKSRALFNHEHGTVAAWAWHLLHALTANLLRPGGAFEAVGTVDLLPAMVSFPTVSAPKTRVSGYPALFLQMPSTALVEEISTQGKGRIQALICIDGDPISNLPQPAKVRDALGELQLLVCIDSASNATTEIADWVLPAKAFWEQDALHLFDGPTLPYKHIQASKGVLPGPAQAREEEAILADLFSATGAPIFGGAWGSHLRAMGRWLAGTPLEKQVDRLLRWTTELDLKQLQAMPHGLDQGELDRGLWRATTEGERINLVPSELLGSIQALRPPSSGDPSIYLLNSTTLPPQSSVSGDPKAAQRAVGIGIHPDCGFENGQTVRVISSAGEVQGNIRLDPSLHPESIHIPWNSEVGVGNLIPMDLRDPFTGTPKLTGVHCTIQAV